MFGPSICSVCVLARSVESSHHEDVAGSNRTAVDKVGGVACEVALQEAQAVHPFGGQRGGRPVGRQHAVGQLPRRVRAHLTRVIPASHLSHEGPIRA